MLCWCVLCVVFDLTRVSMCIVFACTCVSMRASIHIEKFNCTCMNCVTLIRSLNFAFID